MFLVIPRVLLAILLVAILGSTSLNIVLALTVAFWPVTARLVRGEYIAFSQRQFVEAARSVGAGHFTIMYREILPSAIPIILVTATFLMSQAILSEAGLSFLGLADPNTSSWGRMVFTAQRELRHAWWSAVFPGVAIVLVVMSLNLAGDGLSEVINPKTARLQAKRGAKTAESEEPASSPS
jgi:peptide/nickel transport system permease protein